MCCFDYNLFTLFSRLHRFDKKMKFRCKITDCTYVQRFYHAIHMISKFCKQFVIRISVDGLFLIAFDEVGERQPIVWCKIPQQQYFSEYNLVGVSDQFNEICLKVTPQILLKVLISFKPSQLCYKALKISLTNRRTPCLTCELMKTDGEQARLSLHDVPVEVIPRKEWGDIAAPEIALQPDLTVTLPDLENLESIWEKLKSLSRHIVVLANGRGALSLRIETDLSDVTSHFKDLTVETSERCENMDEFVKGRVKCSKFMLLKDLYQANAIKVHLQIRDRKYLLFDVFYDELTVHYIIPAVKK